MRGITLIGGLLALLLVAWLAKGRVTSPVAVPTAASGGTATQVVPAHDAASEVGRQVDAMMQQRQQTLEQAEQAGEGK